MEIVTELEIEAAPARVWKVLTDFPAYPQWNPFITEISGELAVGSRLSITYSFSDGGESRFRPEVVALRPGQELRWVVRVWFRGLFDTEHFLLLRETPGGSTRLVQGDKVDGWAVKYMGKRLTLIARGFVGMNEALKRFVER